MYVEDIKVKKKHLAHCNIIRRYKTSILRCNKSKEYITHVQQTRRTRKTREEGALSEIR